ncbi:MAG: sulfatase-like hydrolase/transferase [Polyangiales bacterium]
MAQPQDHKRSLLFVRGVYGSARSVFCPSLRRFRYARAAHQKPEPNEAKTLRELYDGEITYWDSEFGKFIAELKSRNLYDDRTIVITADHGEEFYDHGGYWHGTTLYDEQVHVPLFVKLPNSKQGGTSINHWVQSIDIAPTIMSILKFGAPVGWQGGDLFTGTQQVFAEESHEGNVLGVDPQCPRF